eukprot:608837-Rhodomonas_salina.1
MAQLVARSWYEKTELGVDGRQVGQWHSVPSEEIASIALLVARHKTRQYRTLRSLGMRSELWAIRTGREKMVPAAVLEHP